MYRLLLLLVLLLGLPVERVAAQARHRAVHSRRGHRLVPHHPFQQHDSLLLAVATNNLPEARKLLRHGADVNGVVTKADSVGYIYDEYGDGHYQDVVWLPDWSFVSAGELPLAVAISRGKAGMVDFLLAHGATTRAVEPMQQNLLREWALPMALGYVPNQAAVLRRLLAQAMPKDSIDAQGLANALTQAIQYNRDVRNTMARAPDEQAEQRTLRRHRNRMGYRHDPPPIYPLRPDSVSQRLLEMLLAAGADPCGSKTNYEEMRRPSPLYLAASCGEVVLARYLATHGAGINVPEKNTRSTPLHIAAQSGDTAMVRLLLTQGANPLATDLAGRTPLHVAARTNSPGVVKLLLKAGADVNCLTDQKPSGKQGWGNFIDEGLVHQSYSPLSVAAEAGQAEIGLLLLAAGARPGTLNLGHESPLLLACKQSKLYFDLEKAAASAAANPQQLVANASTGTEDDEENESWTPARATVLVPPAVLPRELALQLLKYGADPTVADSTGETPLRVALKTDDTLLVRALLAHGANPNHADRHGYTDVVYTRSLPALRLVLAHGAQLRGANTSPVFASACDLPFVEACLAAGIRVSDVDDQGQTPLHAALDTKLATAEVVAFYLAHGAPADAADSRGYTPLGLAASAWEEVAPLQLLLDAKANPDGTEGQRPLIEAAKAGCVPCMQLLLSKGAHPNLDDGRQTALLAVVENEKSNLEALKLLLAAGADPNMANSSGTTPLQGYAAELQEYVPRRRREASATAALELDAEFMQGACLLLEKGAKADIPDKEGKTCLDILRNSSSLPVFRALLTELGQPVPAPTTMPGW